MQPKKKEEVSEVLCGLFSRKEAAQFIAKGSRHVHSNMLGDRDACAKVTHQLLGGEKGVLYPWESAKPEGELKIVSSRERYDVIRTMISQTRVGTKRDLKEKLESVLEELVSNSIYHAYRAKDGAPKYPRRQSANLEPSEHIDVRYSVTPEGVYLSVSDQGGSLSFSDIAASFTRCYGKGEAQIDTKESGAGLGLYMAFEMCTHMKIVCEASAKTTISCWLADKHTFDPDTFSFNFFEGRRHAAK